MTGEVFPLQPSCEHIKTAEYINLWLSIPVAQGGRNGAPAVGQMCLGWRGREGIWGQRGGVRGEAAGKQKPWQLPPPHVP